MTTDTKITAAPTQPVPGTPEHAAAMVALYDSQTQLPAAAAPAAPQTDGTPQTPRAPEVTPPVDPNAPAPKLTDESEAAKTDETPEAPEQKPAAPNLGELFDSGDLLSGIASETVPEDLVKTLEAAGLKGEQVKALSERMRGLLALEAQVATQKLHTAAGGSEQFAALVKWGQANLTTEQRAFYDSELNGPNAAEAIAVLTARMNKGADPRLTQVNASATPPVTAFRDSTEMQIAMSNPLYRTSEAYRREVAQKLRFSAF